MGDEALVDEVKTKADPAAVKNTVDPKVVKNTANGTGVGCSADGKVAARWNFLSTAANALGGDLSDWGGLVYKPRTPVHNCSKVGGAPCASSASETGMMRNSLEPQDFPFVPEGGNVRQNDEQVIFQDGPQVHQCECNPGWCVSPLQRAHPRRPAQPSD
jgi:hypothetical protein